MIRRLLILACTFIVSWGSLSVAHSAQRQCPAVRVRIKAADPNPFDSFGWSVSVSGNTAAVGAIWDDQNGPDSGAAYVFDIDSRVWVQTRKLITSDGGTNGWLGFSAVVDGDAALVGALQHVHDEHSGNGSVYGFRGDQVPGEWAEVQELLASDGVVGDGFGFSIDMSGNTAVIGTPDHDENGTNAGAAYVFHFNGSEWIETQELLASDPTFTDVFGLGVAISGDLVLIGAFGHDGVDPDNFICDSGAAYLFRFDEQADLWEEEAKLTPSDAACGDNFGGAVAVSGDAVLIGSALDDDSGFNSGAAYVFRFDLEASGWVEEQKLLASDGVAVDHFGDTVVIDGNLAVIGARFADAVGQDTGAAYVFRRNAQAVWIEQCKLLPEPNAWNPLFAQSMDIDGQRVIIGAHGEDQQQGAAYIFDLSFNPADLDADGDVDAFDLALLLGNWGPCPEPCTPGDPAQTCPADLNGDCQVEAFDLAILLGDWG